MEPTWYFNTIRNWRKSLRGWYLGLVFPTAFLLLCAPFFAHMALQYISEGGMSSFGVYFYGAVALFYVAVSAYMFFISIRQIIRIHGYLKKYEADFEHQLKFIDTKFDDDMSLEYFRLMRAEGRVRDPFSVKETNNGKIS